MTFLIDTNVFITAEPFAGNLESTQPLTNRFLNLAKRHSHRTVVHPATRDDLERTPDSKHRKQNLASYAKYVEINETDVSSKIWEAFPENPSPNDACDARILASLENEIVDFLVTNDKALYRRAVTLGHEPRVLTTEEALERLEAWHPKSPTPPPTVKSLQVARIDASQQLFDDLRKDYPEFDKWLSKVKKDSENRRCWIIPRADGGYEAIALVKDRDHHPFRPNKNAIKLSTFKVGSQANGRRLGELLLKAVLRWAAEEPNRPSELFVEVKDDKEHLAIFLEDFGFKNSGEKGPGESIYIKTLDPPPDSTKDGLKYNLLFGPPAIRRDQPIYIIPIQRQWFNELFPDAPMNDWNEIEPLEGIERVPEPHGNAIRKAYLCHSNIAPIPPGSTLLFYQTQTSSNNHSKGIKNVPFTRSISAVVAIGVAEKSFRLNKPKDTFRISFKRTVFSKEEIERMHKGGKKVLTILFRHDRFPAMPWTLEELIANGVVRGSPRSVTTIMDRRGIAWVEKQLGASL